MSIPLPMATINSLCFGYCHIHDTYHYGVVTTGNPTSLCGPMTLPNARISDIATAFCGVSSPIVTGKYSLVNGNMPTARMTDRFVGPWTGTIIDGVHTSLT